MSLKFFPVAFPLLSKIASLPLNVLIDSLISMPRKTACLNNIPPSAATLGSFVEKTLNYLKHAIHGLKDYD